MEPLFGVFPVPDAERQDAVVEQVLLADRLGLDLVGIQDHPYQRRHLDAWTLLSYLAGRTERVRLFPDVANLPLRHPALLAKAAATQDGSHAQAKLVTARFFADRLLPETGALRRKIEGGADSLMALPPEMFQAA